MSNKPLPARPQRQRLKGFKTLDDVLNAIKKSRNILVTTGAGISVSSGIPDFRSPDTGLYNTLDCAKYDIPSPELLFDYDFFKIDLRDCEAILKRLQSESIAK
jgi:NAD-dependent SIR2 family protein deacetylase